MAALDVSKLPYGLQERFLQVSNIDTGSKFKMAAVAILNLVYRS